MKAVIFDMDGLMFDTERVFIGAWDYAGEQLGVGKAGYMLMRTLGMNTPACEQAWHDEFGPAVDVAAMWGHTRDYMEDYYRRFTVSAKPGLYDLLSYLKSRGCRLAVASSSPVRRIRIFMLHPLLSEHPADAGQRHPGGGSGRTRFLSSGPEG